MKFAGNICILILFFGFSTEDKFTDNPELCESRCNDEILIRHLASCEILSPESIINLAVKNIEPLCRNLDETLSEINKYLKTCIPPPPGNLFMSYIAGLKVVDVKLCSAESSYAKKFGPCYQCLHELKSEFDGCSGPADWTEDSDNAKICKSYKNIVDCYYVKTAKVCGIQAALIMKELVTDVIDSVLCISCRGIKSNPYVKDPMPEQYIKRNRAQQNPYPLITLKLLSIIFIYFILI